MDGLNILIVDDEPNIRAGLAKGLAREAGSIETAEDAESASAMLKEMRFQLVITDVRLPGSTDGIDLMRSILSEDPDTAVIVITAHGTVENAVEAMRAGAFDFITKPVDLSLIREQVRKAFSHQRLRAENRELKDRLAHVGEVAGIIGNSDAIKRVIAQVRQVADTDATVLIEGESGTGKELVARALHDFSSRRASEFVAVNLGALPESLLESELFGHEKGSFTGASRRKPGCFERACGGTLFLDEVTEIPAKSQVDLLRVLETSQFTLVGGEDVVNSDARIVSATNRSIPPLVRSGHFREDLYYRLNIVPIRIPPLRERRVDIPFLSDHFLDTLCVRHRRRPKSIASDALQVIAGADWPGNVRQLRNVIERIVVTVDADTITAEHLPPDVFGTEAISPKPRSLAQVTDQAERSAIQAALLASNFHRERTAELLGISLRTLHYKMRRYQLP